MAARTSEITIDLTAWVVGIVIIAVVAIIAIALVARRK